jgi:hypothetical protein
MTALRCLSPTSTAELERRTWRPAISILQLSRRRCGEGFPILEIGPSTYNPSTITYPARNMHPLERPVFQLESEVAGPPPRWLPPQCLGVLCRP